MNASFMEDKIISLYNEDYGLIDSVMEELDDKDFNTLASYYLWYTSIYAKEKGLYKLQAVDSSMFTCGVDDWVFAGVVDFGVKGEYTCAEGHAIRYGYYAYSPSLDKTIIFGSKCAENFFRISSSLLSSVSESLVNVDAEIYYCLENMIEVRTEEEKSLLSLLRKSDKFRDMAIKELGITTINMFLSFLDTKFPVPNTLLRMVRGLRFLKIRVMYSSLSGVVSEDIIKDIIDSIDEPIDFSKVSCTLDILSIKVLMRYKYYIDNIELDNNINFSDIDYIIKRYVALVKKEGFNFFKDKYSLTELVVDYYTEGDTGVIESAEDMFLCSLLYNNAKLLINTFNIQSEEDFLKVFNEYGGSFLSIVNGEK